MAELKDKLVSLEDLKAIIPLLGSSDIKTLPLTILNSNDLAQTESGTYILVGSKSDKPVYVKETQDYSRTVNGSGSSMIKSGSILILSNNSDEYYDSRALLIPVTDDENIAPTILIKPYCIYNYDPDKSWVRYPNTSYPEILGLQGNERTVASSGLIPACNKSGKTTEEMKKYVYTGAGTWENISDLI